MTLFLGVLVTAASLAVFVYSLPRGGKTARFVGGQSEGYIVAGLVVLFGLGLVLTVSGLKG